MRGIADNQMMMIGLAYVLPFELKQFQLFHAVMHVDAMAKTNKEQRPLVTVTSKDSPNKMFTVLRVFMPCEQSWAYRWLFQTVFPTLFGRSLLADVKSIITDGNSQEISQLEDAMHQYFTSAIRIRCSWHIIDRGWQQHLSWLHMGKSKKGNKNAWRMAAAGEDCMPDHHYISQVIHHWMITWAPPRYCIDSSEFAISKALFVCISCPMHVGTHLARVRQCR